MQLPSCPNGFETLQFLQVSACTVWQARCDTAVLHAEGADVAHSHQISLSQTANWYKHVYDIHKKMNMNIGVNKTIDIGVTMAYRQMLEMCTS